MDMIAVPSERRAGALKLSDFEFPLPSELIAQEPAPRRDAARLLVLDRASDSIEHTHVYDLPRFLRAGDLLVVNDTRVLPARIFGRGPAGGAVELLLIRQQTLSPSTPAIEAAESGSTPSPASPAGEGRGEGSNSSQPLLHPSAPPRFPHPNPLPQVMRARGAVLEGPTWLCMGKPAQRLRLGTTLHFGDLTATVLAKDDDGTYVIEFSAAAALQAFLAQHGEVPLPPYIARPDGPLPFDRERYQTIFAAKPGAIAAPTAGLHFTPELLGGIEAGGIGLARVTLHVGPGTFRPIRSSDPDAHVMDPEWCEIPEATVVAIRRTKAAGGRIVAVGTTTTRALESSLDTNGELQSGGRWATRYIRPGYGFRVIDCLFTNFHLPGSTLLLLVSAIAGREHILAAYAEAIRQRYRFYSYGDAMLIL